MPHTYAHPWPRPTGPHPVGLVDTNHVGFSDLPIIAPVELRPTWGSSEVMGPRYVEIQNRLGLDFFDNYLRGLDRGFPKRTLAACPELIVQDVAAALRA